MLSYIRALLRLCFFVLGTTFYLGRYLLKVAFTGPNLDRGIRLCQEFMQVLLPVLGIHTSVEGKLPNQRGLIVCNHRSYVDPFIIMKDLRAIPVGKIEVSKWPLIGAAGRSSGVIFVDRNDRKNRNKVRQEITKIINNGYIVINFAEGTTHSRPQTIEFNPGLFFQAAKESFPIYPIAIEYEHETDHWVGDVTFFIHFLKKFRKSSTNIRIRYCKSITGDDGSILMQKTKEKINTKLKEIRTSWYEND